MSTSFGSNQLLEPWEPPVVKPLDKSESRVSVTEGGAQEPGRISALDKAVKLVSGVGLLAATGLWSNLPQNDVLARCIVAAGAMVLMFQVLHARRYAVASMFEALAGRGVSRRAITPIVVFGMMSATASAADLSKYRDFQLGADIATVTKQTGTSTSQVKAVHRRPALIQEFAWRPQPLGRSSTSETAQEVLFSFYNGELFRIVVTYDRYETEGLTTSDIIEAISASYGLSAKPSVPVKAAYGGYSDPEDVLAQWQDPNYRFELIRSSFGPTFRLIGNLKRLEGPVQAATLEATRLDEQEAPQRDAARTANEEEAARAKLEKTRLVNKPRFRL